MGLLTFRQDCFIAAFLEGVGSLDTQIKVNQGPHNQGWTHVFFLASASMGFSEADTCLLSRFDGERGFKTAFEKKA